MKTSISSSFGRLLCAMGASAAFAVTSFGQAVITTGHGDGADTYLSNDSNSGPTIVHGGDTGLNMRAITDLRARVVLLRFDVSDFVAASLTDATLTLNFTASNRTRTWNVFGLADEGLDGWLEGATNYDNGPGILPATLGNYAIDGTAWSNLGTFAVQSGTGQQTTDPVSLNLDAFLTGNTNGYASLLLAFPSGTDTNPDWTITSKEGNALLAPTLDLPSAQAIPEPSTYAMIFGVVALAGSFYFRRRKN